MPLPDHLGEGEAQLAAQQGETVERRAARFARAAAIIEAAKANEQATATTAEVVAEIDQLAPDFGDPETMLNSRKWLQEACEAKGARFTGGGCGGGESDIDIELEGCMFNVRIRPIMRDREPGPRPKPTEAELQAILDGPDTGPVNLDAAPRPFGGRRPNVGELEELLKPESTDNVRVMPDGSVRPAKLRWLVGSWDANDSVTGYLGAVDGDPLQAVDRYEVSLRDDKQGWHAYHRTRDKLTPLGLHIAATDAMGLCEDHAAGTGQTDAQKPPDLSLVIPDAARVSADIAAAMAHRIGFTPAFGGATLFEATCVTCGDRWPCKTARYFMRGEGERS